MNSVNLKPLKLRKSPLKNDLLFPQKPKDSCFTVRANSLVNNSRYLRENNKQNRNVLGEESKAEMKSTKRSTFAITQSKMLDDKDYNRFNFSRKVSDIGQNQNIYTAIAMAKTQQSQPFGQKARNNDFKTRFALTNASDPMNSTVTSQNVYENLVPFLKESDSCRQQHNMTTGSAFALNNSRIKLDQQDFLA